MKVRLAVTVVVLAMTACIAAVCCRPAKPSSINFDSFQQIQKGMTLQQVWAILGDSRNESANPYACGSYPSRFGGEHRYEWWGPDYAIYIWFDRREMVRSKEFSTHAFGPAKTPSLWDKACSWLPWSPSTAPN
jgi:hypothetical protein